MTTTPFPEAARPMLELIRRHAPRPGTLPKPGRSNGRELSFPWPKYQNKDSCCCPMGLLPAAKVPNPSGKASFEHGLVDAIPNRAITNFGAWWDAQTDAKAAMDFVWPEEAIC